MPMRYSSIVVLKDGGSLIRPSTSCPGATVRISNNSCASSASGPTVLVRAAETQSNIECVSCKSLVFPYPWVNNRDYVFKSDSVDAELSIEVLLRFTSRKHATSYRERAGVDNTLG